MFPAASKKKSVKKKSKVKAASDIGKGQKGVEALPSTFSPPNSKKTHFA